jgi:hypothetical protein
MIVRDVQILHQVIIVSWQPPELGPSATMVLGKGPLPRIARRERSILTHGSGSPAA